MIKHVMFYVDKFDRPVYFMSYNYNELKVYMLEMSQMKDVGDIFYIDPETNEERKLCYYND